MVILAIEVVQLKVLPLIIEVQKEIHYSYWLFLRVMDKMLYEYMQFFSLLMIVNRIYLGLGLLIGQNKEIKDFFTVS